MKKSEQTIDLEFEEVQLDGKFYNVTAKCTGTWADCGIGPYECHGYKGFDSYMDIDEMAIEVNPFVQEVDKDGNKKEIIATDDLLDDITDELYRREEYIYIKLKEASYSNGEDEHE